MTNAPTTRRHLLILSAICALAYFLGLTTHGVAAWHEGQRLLVARQMLDAGEWIVPRINGHPYLAKPPMFSWVQMLIASVRGASVSLVDTRLSVAIFGWLGVIVTYFAGREMLQAPRELGVERGRAWSTTAAFWAAVMLATGIDYVRSARVGELDMLLVAPVTAAIWLVFRAWRSHLGIGPEGAVVPARTRWLECVLAALCATIAGLTKGPPALAMIAIGSYGGVLLHAARSRGALRLRLEVPMLLKGQGDPVQVAPARAWVTIAGAVVGGGVALALSLPQVEGTRDVVGALIGASMGAMVTASLAGVVVPGRAMAGLAALSRTHPVLVLGLPVLVLWAWMQMVSARIDPGLVDVWTSEEVGDNLRPFRPASPISILEAASFGVGLGSAAFFATVGWMLWRRPRLEPGWWMLLAWSIGGLVVFSLFGKGLARYVLPVWPAMAMVGGIGVAEALRLAGEPRRRGLWNGLVAGVVALALVSTWWYADGRARWFSHRSPRDFVASLLAHPRVEPARIAAFELYDPGVDYYLDALSKEGSGPGVGAHPVGSIRTRFNLTGVEPWSMEELQAIVARDGPWTLIVREHQHDRAEQRPAIERLALAGFRVEVLAMDGRYHLDGGDTPLRAVRVEVVEPLPRPEPMDLRHAEPD